MSAPALHVWIDFRGEETTHSRARSHKHACTDTLVSLKIGICKTSPDSSSQIKSILFPEEKRCLEKSLKYNLNYNYPLIIEWNNPSEEPEVFTTRQHIRHLIQQHNRNHFCTRTASMLPLRSKINSN